MKAKRFLCSIFAFALVLSTMGFTVLAEDTDIIEVGTDKAYETWSAAIGAATDADSDGAITYHVYGKVLMDSHNVKGAAATINIIGMTDDAELSVETANPTDNGVVYVSDNTIETVNFSNLKLSRPNGEWRGNEGHHNRFFTVWDSDGSTDLITYTSCVFPYGAGNNQYGKTTYTDCDFYNDVYYALWIYGSGDKGVVEVTGGTFDADRGVKIYSEDPSATVSTTITDSTFAIDSKPAIVSSIAGELVVEDVDATECEYGLLASEPKDGRADLESAAITVDGEEPVFVAKVGNMVCTDIAYAEAESNGSKPVEIPVAKIGTKYYTTIQAAIDAATDGDTVIVKEGTYEVPSMKAGITVEGEGNVVLEGTLSGNLKNLTLKNLYIKGSNAQRWAYAKGEYLTFENVTFHATGVYAIHFDGIEAGINLTYKNCTIIGWAAMGGSPGSCVFDGCTIRDNGTYGVVRTYFDAEFKDCTFDVDTANQDDVYQDGLHVVDAVMKVNNCTNANGNIEDILNISDDAYIFVDDEIALAPENKTLAANIGFDVYETLQEAIDAVTDGDTITLLADHNGDVTVTQNADIDIILDGNGKNFDGTIYIYGKARYNGAETLTIQNVNFVTDEAKDFISCNTTDSDKRYAHNITIKDCSFTADTQEDVVAMRFRQCYNINVEDCSFEGLHSVMWATGGGNGLTFDNITAEDCKNGISTGTSAEVVVKNSTIEAVGEGGYGIRTDASGAYTLTVENSDIDAYYPIIARKATSTDYTLNIEDSSNFTATNADGYDIVVTSGKDDEAFVKAEIYIDIAETVDASVFSTHLASVNGVFYKTLADALAAATAGDTVTLLSDTTLESANIKKDITIDLNDNALTVNAVGIMDSASGAKAAIQAWSDVTIKNGNIVVTSTATINNGVFYVAGSETASLTIKDVNLTANDTNGTDLFVTSNPGTLNIIDSVINASNVSKLINGGDKGSAVISGSKINVSDSARAMVNIALDADDSEINISNLTDNALRNVSGSIDNSVISIDGAEYGIKNTADGEVLTVTASTIRVTNTANESGNADIYLTGRDKLVNTNSIIDAKIFIDGGEGEDVVLVTLNFATNGGSAIDTVERNMGESVDLLDYKSEKSGYSFVGWYSDEALTQEVISVTLDIPTTVYAKWKENTIYVGGSGGSGISRYTVIFNTNGGTSVDKISKLKNSTVDLSECITEKEGYTFEGWYTDKELTDKVTSVKLTDDITLYAKWVEIANEPGTDEPGTTEGVNLFADVKTTDWFYENVKYVVENELMNGVDEDRFAPNDTLTRAMLVTVLYRLEGEPEVENVSFTDVDADAYYANAVSWAKQNGIVNGVTENEFAPNSDITREQIAAILHRYAQYKGYDVSVGESTDILSYADAESVSEYAVSSMQYAVGSGLIKGKSATTLNPLDNATRAEIASILQRFIEANSN